MKYRDEIKKPLSGHNPDNVIYLPDGAIRLLEDDEISKEHTIELGCIWFWCSRLSCWLRPASGRYLRLTYACSVSRDELRKLRQTQ